MTVEFVLKKASNYGLYFEALYMIEMSYDPEDILEILDLD